MGGGGGDLIQVTTRGGWWRSGDPLSPLSAGPQPPISVIRRLCEQGHLIKDVNSQGRLTFSRLVSCIDSLCCAGPTVGLTGHLPIRRLVLHRHGLGFILVCKCVLKPWFGFILV